MKGKRMLHVVPLAELSLHRIDALRQHLDLVIPRKQPCCTSRIAFFASANALKAIALICLNVSWTVDMIQQHKLKAEFSVNAAVILYAELKKVRLIGRYS